MTTLMIVRSKNGRVLHRCDAKCYDAQGPVCKCICGGRNHGAGVKKGMDIIRDLHRDFEDPDNKHEAPFKPYQVTLSDKEEP